MPCSAKNARSTRRRVASSATAFAPFSQNSAVWVWPGSGQAHPGQSKPVGWLTRSSVSAVRRTPICSWDVFMAFRTAGTPAAWSCRCPTSRLSSVGSSRGAFLAMVTIQTHGRSLRGGPMRRTTLLRSAAPFAAALSVLMLTSACGDVKITSDSSKGDSDKDSSASTASTASPQPSAAVDTSAAEGNWLLGLQTAGGSDAEKSTTVYVTYDPSTGRATKRTMPGVTAASSSPDLAALLVSADRAWAIPDTGISGREEKSGQLTVYSLTSDATRVVDIRRASGV